MSSRTVVDTDIGTDIDDTWALALALRSPELDVQLVTTVSGDPMYRARLAGAVVTAAGRRDIAVGAGRPGGRDVRPGEPQAGLAATHAPLVQTDGVAALVAACAEPTVIVAMGPLSNLAAALAIDPSIASRARVVAMVGSVRTGYRGATEPVPEYNARVDADACRNVFAAPWPVTIAPLDITHDLYLRDEAYQRVLAARDDPLVGCVLETYREWLDHTGRPELFDRRSTTLHDCVAVYLAHDESLVEIETLPLTVDGDGLMRVEDGAPAVRVATGWRDQDAFVDHLVTRLTAGT